MAFGTTKTEDEHLKNLQDEQAAPNAMNVKLQPH